MKLKKLLNLVNILNCNVDLETDVKKLTSDSRKVKKGYVFVAIKGENHDGNNFIAQAIENGAIAVVSEDLNICSNYSLPYIQVKNARSALAKMWSSYYNEPSKEMKIIAITGTNGKTSSAYFLYKILRNAKKKCGLISTIECLINDKVIDINGGSEVLDKISAMTTPDPEILYSILYKMKRKGVKYVVMEASSHALDQHKLDGLTVNIGVFTNLTHEHLDYHKNMQDYFSAKEKLFKKCLVGVVNIDDGYGKILINKYKGRLFSVSCKQESDYKAEAIECDTSGCRYTLNKGEKKINIETRLCGTFMVYNSICAIACADILGIDEKNIKNGIYNLLSIKGRVERYKDKNIYIDYAHTPYAMENIINSIKEIEKNKKLIVLFGCGGDRDKEKRAEMGDLCSKLADIIIITSDNPRSEDSKEIIKDIVKGIDKTKTHIIIPERKEAIKYAIKILSENKVLLLLGKGHENYEIDNEGKKHFDERIILDEAFEK
ncbi:MAG: UDP-N-acetylmuramoyl-L-alanyl-D-glutamate--2,6-diaminopimelate ligase [Clostridia bacterium]|nr:UDP-N-acetylmuramoyl-L-alanyl-D-glutamate--2,6-diaminopimelate ligase [Clostridia bacterium]